MERKRTQAFGGDWTQDKLDRLRRYLSAYTTALKKQPFELVYIDAFAGTGYRERRRSDERGEPLFPQLADEEPQEFFDGSPRIALRTEPRFHRFVFVENSEERYGELLSLREEFPALADRMSFVPGDCNEYLQRICGQWDWRNCRAVLFLDPFAMQVEWRTLEAVASTRAIDVWLLWPLMAVNRLLKRYGTIPPSWRKRLEECLGSSDWQDVFYQKRTEPDLFEKRVVRRRKIADFDVISDYFLARLRNIFAGVAGNPLQLRNSRGTPLFLLCFAVANPRGERLALRIAQYILKE